MKSWNLARICPESGPTSNHVHVTHLPYPSDCCPVSPPELTLGQGELAQLTGLVWVLRTSAGLQETPRFNYNCAEPEREHQVQSDRSLSAKAREVCWSTKIPYKTLATLMWKEYKNPVSSVATLLDTAPKVHPLSDQDCHWDGESGCLMLTRKTVASCFQVIFPLPQMNYRQRWRLKHLRGWFLDYHSAFRKGCMVCFTPVANKCSEVMCHYETYPPQTS